MSNDVKVTDIINTSSNESYAVQDSKTCDCAFGITLSEPLAASATIALEIRFSEQIEDNSERFSYDETAKGTIYSLMMCFPTLAPHYDGEWQLHNYYEDGEAACNAMTDYDVTLTCPERFQVLASGHQETMDGVTSIHAENVRELYIIACDDMTVSTVEADGIVFHTCRVNYNNYQPKILKRIYDVAQEHAVAAVSMYTKCFGDYLYDELDMIPFDTDSDAQGMEMPGIITFGWDEVSTATPEYAYYETMETVAHEVAHQWFYCAVGNDQFREPWLDESFADYCDSYYADHVIEQCGDKLSDYSKNLLTNMIVTPSSSDAHYINLPCDAYDEDGYLDVYVCGEQFLQELENAMGSDTFFAMMQDWYSKYNGKIAVGSAFVRTVLAHNNSQKVKKLLQAYLDADCLY